VSYFSYCLVFWLLYRWLCWNMLLQELWLEKQLKLWRSDWLFSLRYLVAFLTVYTGGLMWSLFFISITVLCLQLCSWQCEHTGGGRWMQGIEIARKGKCKERLPKFATLWICKEWNLQGKDFVRNAYPVAYWRTKFLFCVYQFRWHQYLAYCTVYIMWEWLYSVLNM